ncbi:hypothetical protein ACFSTH_10020 [Paenibacillus yanchengensis]|uniref:Thioredoxin domain-containing protein n=1 Tax=Paenibacillus yanchengensis TaxID=2035833 RepID=A0ABW4YNS0_9BACL
MANNVTALKLFTLSACPMGRSMGMVMDEVQARYTSLHIDIIYVEIEAELANEYRIKTNPTTLFINDHNEELFRMEGFVETEVIVDYIEQLNEGIFMLDEKLPPNESVQETYTVYLSDGTKLVAASHTYYNQTAIAAPRIHAILSLLSATADGLYNPFPLETKLISVQFIERVGTVTLGIADYKSLEISEQTHALMKQALQLTLQSFDVTDVELIIA